jgi:hypothetical protein
LRVVPTDHHVTTVVVVCRQRPPLYSTTDCRRLQVVKSSRQ